MTDEEKPTKNEYKSWTDKEKQDLVMLAQIHCNGQSVHWDAVHKNFPNRTKQQIKSMYLNRLKPKLQSQEIWHDMPQNLKQQILQDLEENIPQTQDKQQQIDIKNTKQEQIQPQDKIVSLNHDVQPPNIEIPNIPSIQNNIPTNLDQVSNQNTIDQSNQNLIQVQGDTCPNANTPQPQSDFDLLLNQMRHTIQTWTKQERRNYNMRCEYYNFYYQFLHDNFFQNQSVNEIMATAQAIQEDKASVFKNMSAFMQWDGKSFLMDNETAKGYYNACAISVYKIHAFQGIKEDPPILYPDVVQWLTLDCKNTNEVRYLIEIGKTVDFEKLKIKIHTYILRDLLDLKLSFK